MDINRIKTYMKENKITYEKLSELSKIPLNTLKNIFRGKTSNPRIDTVEAIERALNIEKGFLPENAFPIGANHIPLVGEVVAGIPVESSEYLEGYITVDYPHPEEYFALKVHGDSMINARLFGGDIVIVKKQNFAENGDIVVASLNGESTVKRYKVFGEHIFLMPENAKYEPIPITEKSNLFIFGKVVEVRSKF